jgi:hypothetical protein
MRLLVIIASMAFVGCGARIVEVKTQGGGGFCFFCLDKPDRVTMDKIQGKK